MARRREAPQEVMFDGMDVFSATPQVRDREPGSTSRARKEDAKIDPRKISWAKIAARKKAAPDKCDECVGAMVRGGRWAAPDPAVYSRTQGGVKVLLCWEHSAIQRAIDGLPEFKRPGR